MIFHTRWVDLNFIWFIATTAILSNAIVNRQSRLSFRAEAPARKGLTEVILNSSGRIGDFSHVVVDGWQMYGCRARRKARPQARISGSRTLFDFLAR
jgi:hypothetical protein